MWRTFNCGIGFTVLLDPAQAPAAIEALQASGLAAQVIGRVVKTAGDAPRVHIA
jgi:phosphoribosylformylglycinamidine cyclo-ligase